ncbi:hypothetical protein D1007_03836 [Hordeum vulgare]|nr:hypothetical protein D1007_03836 [Hordeum vulgare]
MTPPVPLNPLCRIRGYPAQCWRRIQAPPPDREQAAMNRTSTTTPTNCWRLPSQTEHNQNTMSSYPEGQSAPLWYELRPTAPRFSTSPPSSPKRRMTATQQGT